MRRNEISFSVGRFKFASEVFIDAVQISVDGQDLYSLVEAIEASARPDWDDDEDFGDTPGVSPELVAPPSEHWLGNPDPNFSEPGLAVVYDCECGYWECGGLLASIEVDDDKVVWSRFARPEGGDPLPLGPFVFARSDYERALSSLRP